MRPLGDRICMIRQYLHVSMYIVGHCRVLFSYTLKDGCVRLQRLRSFSRITLNIIISEGKVCYKKSTVLRALPQL
jgi:hypothetical protein